MAKKVYLQGEEFVFSRVKGNKESDYREGDVNITPANIGASAEGHTHDDRYYTESEVDSKLKGKANTSHGNHVPTTQTADNATFLRNDNTWAKVTPSNIGAQPAGSYASASHTHDDRYYTETEINTKLNGKANSSHTHGNGDITSLDASKITSGTIDIDRLPQGALDRLIKVADDTARFKLTTKDVQLGDSVKVTSTKKMYIVVDETKLSSEAGYEPYTADSATSVPWSGVSGKPSTYTPSSHTHTKSQITDFPTSMPASDVYAWAKASSKPSYTKSEVGLGNVDNTADSAKSVKYATSAGSASSSSKATGLVDYGATTKTIQIGYSGDGISGDAIKYIAGYTTGNGSDVNAKIKDVSKDALKSWLGLGSLAYSSATIPTIPSSLPANGGNSATVNGHTVKSDVPANAKFTDTIYAVATTSANGLMSKDMVTKLNGVDAGANKIIVDSALSSDSTNPVQNKVIAAAVGSYDNQLSDMSRMISLNASAIANKMSSSGDSKDCTTTFTSGDSSTGSSTPPAVITSGEKHSSLFNKFSTAVKNVRWLLSKMGTTDISTLGNGTVTGALSTLNSNIRGKQNTLDSPLFYRGTIKDDMNSYNTRSHNGYYYIATTPSNAPTSINIGYAIVLVLFAYNDFGVQIIIKPSNNTFLLRERSGATPIWSVWKKLTMTNV